MSYKEYRGIFQSGNVRKNIVINPATDVDLTSSAVGVLQPENGGTGTDTLSTLTITQNNTEIGTFQIDTSSTINIEMPIITHGTTMPTGGNNGDIYLLHK